jgi:hypothetical protein
MIELLDSRIRKILSIDRAEAAETGEESLAEAHCFHLMEIQRILEGKPTCGIYDDYGAPPTIDGPLFSDGSNVAIK